MNTRSKMEWEALKKACQASLFPASHLKSQRDKGMKISYDPKTNTLTIILKDNGPVEESDEVRPGVILDYDKEGNLLSLEVLDASERVSEVQKIELQTTA